MPFSHNHCFLYCVKPEPSADHDPTHYFPTSYLTIPHHKSSRTAADPFANPNTIISSSVPSQSYMKEHMSRIVPDERDAVVDLDHMFEAKGHGRSRSVDLRKSNSSSPSSRKKLSRVSQQALQDSNRSLTSVQEGSTTALKRPLFGGLSSSRRNSMCSADSDSGAGNKSDSASTNKKYNIKPSHGSGEVVSKGYSSGESSKYTKKRRAGGTEKTKEGTTLGSKISRVFSWSDLRPNSSPKLNTHRVSDKRKGSNPNSGEGSRKSSGGGSSGSGESNQGKMHLRNPQSSSDGGGREKRAHSPVVIYRDDDPSYIHNSLQLFLVMDVFKDECFKMVFRSSMVRYGEPGEVPMLVVISNIRAYLFRVVAPERYWEICYLVL